MLKPKDPRWRDTEEKIEKYVDDQIHMSVVNLRAEPLLEQAGVFFKETKAPKTQRMLENITERVEQRGMVVNDAKTAVMCVSDAVSFEPRVSLEGRHGRIEGVNQLKFLGVTLDSDCSFGTHIQNLRTSIRRRSWALAKLRRRGMTEKELKRVYTSMIRPAVEYAAPAWHSMITQEQVRVLESQQTQCLKNILGPGLSASKMRQKLDIEQLEIRREKAVIKFSQKCLKSDRFSRWFQYRNIPPYERRSSFIFLLL